jgi:hypothetical protein
MHGHHVRHAPRHVCAELTMERRVHPAQDCSGTSGNLAQEAQRPLDTYVEIPQLLGGILHCKLTARGDPERFC